ncbi:hypothetical protein [Kitasatospora sp. NPDC057541]|uniref:hypothetical protein n=1 Tax=unclassified Kitasatospora TaxID=2633591 RepID=UPI00367B59B6
MTLSDDTGQDATHASDRYRTRHGRHGRPGPFGGRLRLPTLRFSGAAMAMSTVVGISIATTFLLNEQQGVGRRAGVARVGSSAPPPSPSTSPDTIGGNGTTSGTGTASGPDAAGPNTTAGRRSAAPATPAPGASGPAAGTRAPDSVPAQRSAGPAAPRTEGSPSTAPLAGGPAPRHGVTDGPATEQPGPGGAPETLAGGRADHPQSADEQLAAADGAQTARRPAEDASPTGASPSPSPSVPAASPSSATPRPFVPAAPGPGAPAPAPREWTGGTLGTADTAADGSAEPATDSVGSGPTKGSTKDTGVTRPAAGTDAADDQALAGAAVVQSLGRDGTRHVLALTVGEPLTALQAEFRLAPGTAAPGVGTAWTDLGGAVVTAHQERGAAVYRFTTPPGTDVRPGRYTFTVRGTRSTGQAGPARSVGPRTPGSWNASAFGIGRPRAVAALGTFTAPPAVPAPAPARTTAPAPLPAPRAAAPTG